jgi:hypothetical protein
VFYAFSVAAMVAVLAAGVVTWGTDVSPRTVVMRDPVFRITQHPALKSGVEEERLAAAIVNEPLQHHVAGQIRMAADTGAGRPEASPLPALRTGKVPLAPRVASTQVPGQRATARTDSDVTLLAALVAHANGAATPGSAGAEGDFPARRGVTGIAVTENTGRSMGTTSGVAGEVERGVIRDVGRGMATAEILSAQLRQCARLAGSEAALCHARACTGRWGRDNACRVTTAE